jgi:hypothetical protein
MITSGRLREVLDYDPDTGNFRWIKMLANRGPVGAIAGNVELGYVRIRIDGHRYFAHRLAWLYVTGEWPKREIDHIDGMPDNNRFANLREATRGENRRNSRKGKESKSQFKGVVYAPYSRSKTRKWRAVITAAKRTHHLGYFETPEEAHAVYAARARELFGEFARSE